MIIIQHTTLLCNTHSGLPLTLPDGSSSSTVAPDIPWRCISIVELRNCKVALWDLLGSLIAVSCTEVTWSRLFLIVSGFSLWLRDSMSYGGCSSSAIIAGSISWCSPSMFWFNASCFFFSWPPLMFLGSLTTKKKVNGKTS